MHQGQYFPAHSDSAPYDTSGALSYFAGLFKNVSRGSFLKVVEMVAEIGEKFRKVLEGSRRGSGSM